MRAKISRDHAHFIDHTHQVELLPQLTTRARFDKTAWFSTPRRSTLSILASDKLQVVQDWQETFVCSLVWSTV